MSIHATIYYNYMCMYLNQIGIKNIELSVEYNIISYYKKIISRRFMSHVVAKNSVKQKTIGNYLF